MRFYWGGKWVFRVGGYRIQHLRFSVLCVGPLTVEWRKR